MKLNGRLILFFTAFFLSLSAVAENSDVTLDQFLNHIESSVRGVNGSMHVRELIYIRELAERLGVRVWIYGGTATTIANKIHKNKGQGSQVGIKELFNESQDFDLILDASHEKLKIFSKKLRKKFNYDWDGRPRWDIGLYHESLGNHRALNSSEVQSQHTDSWSTGLIEISDPPIGQKRFVDLKSENGSMPFLEDVHNNTIHFYYSEQHTQTGRFKDGKNPEIISCVRFLTKVSLFNLKIDDQDLKILRKIIDAFDPGLKYEKYVETWMKYNLIKMLKHSSDRAKTLQLLIDMNLFDKLVQFFTNIEGGADVLRFLQGDNCKKIFSSAS